MQGALEAIPGVDSADVDFANKTATVAVGPGVDAQELIEAIQNVDAKYSVSLK